MKKINCSLCGKHNKQIFQTGQDQFGHDEYATEYRMDVVQNCITFGPCAICDYPINCCTECVTRLTMKPKDIYLKCAISHDEQHQSVELVDV